MSNKREVVIVSGVRTAIGTFGGSLKDVPPGELAAQVVKEAVSRANIEPEQVQHAVFGNVAHTEPRDMYLSRVAAINGGLPHATPAVTVNRLCGSGLQAIVSATQLIEVGECDTTIAGGAESMSRVPYWLPSMRFGARMNDAQAVDALVGALSDPFDSCHMGVTAENVATKWGISREEQDQFAVESHRRAAAATEAGHFKDQILPIDVKQRRQTVSFASDEHIRSDASLEGMAKLRPVFDRDGSVTAGNASGLNDAAAAVVLMAADTAAKQGLKPLARIVDYAFAGVDPKYMGIGPVPAVNNLLKKTGVALQDIDLIELNEAFAAQALAVMRDLNLSADKTNPLGSGISLGHPIGATGCILTVKAAYELQRRQQRYALVTMCIGGGQGIAALLERV